MLTRRVWMGCLLVALAAAAPAFGEAPKQLLLVGQGPDGHPAQSHEYAAGLRVLKKCLAGTPGLEVTTARADEPWKEGPDLIARSDGVVLFLAEGARWAQQDPRRLEALRQMAKRGGGVVVLHWAMGTKDAKYIEEFQKLAGACHGGPDRKYKELETKLTVAAEKHPVCTAVGSFPVKDEFYYQLKRVAAKPGVTPLLTARIDDEDEMVAWAWERPDGGRSFGFSGLHFHDNWKLEPYRRLVAQGVLWSVKLPVPKDGLKVEVTAEDLKLK
jgi:type 1 glutamine amidotransferase